jgi:Methylamine utilisation protein MauE
LVGRLCSDQFPVLTAIGLRPSEAIVCAKVGDVTAVLGLACRLLVGLALLLAAILKTQDFRRFARHLATDFRFGWAGTTVAAGVVIAEAAIGIVLMTDQTIEPAVAAAALLSSFAALSILRRRSAGFANCWCFGAPRQGSNIAQPRLLLLLVAATGALVTAAIRPITLPPTQSVAAFVLATIAIAFWLIGTAMLDTWHRVTSIASESALRHRPKSTGGAAYGQWQ